MSINYGDWEIVREIGSGSFGTVYEIKRETLGFEQKAALKTISIPHSQSDVDSIRNTGMDEASIGEYYKDITSQIMIELKAMEKLKGHTNIVSYEDHEVRKKESGIGWDIYIRMELLTPLSKYLRDHSLSRKEIIRLGIDLCRALERCEALNIIHRDIKPDNIFLSEMGDGKLGDFGIARTVERTMSGLSKKGTYSFMAPEVYMGQPYGKTVDIYSLGLVLYQLLNHNRGPFLPIYPAPIRFQDQEQALVRRIKGDPLPAPVQADKNLAEVVLKACSYDPGQRYSGAEEMRLALQAVAGADTGDVPLAKLTETRSLYDSDEATIGLEGSYNDVLKERDPVEPENEHSVFKEEASQQHFGDQPIEEGTVSIFHNEIPEEKTKDYKLTDDRTVSVLGKEKGTQREETFGFDNKKESGIKEPVEKNDLDEPQVKRGQNKVRKGKKFALIGAAIFAVLVGFAALNLVERGISFGSNRAAETVEDSVSTSLQSDDKVNSLDSKQASTTIQNSGGTSERPANKIMDLKSQWLSMQSFIESISENTEMAETYIGKSLYDIGITDLMLNYLKDKSEPNLKEELGTAGEEVNEFYATDIGDYYIQYLRYDNYAALAFWYFTEDLVEIEFQDERLTIQEIYVNFRPVAEYS